MEILIGDRCVLVDDEDAFLLSKGSWHIHKGTHTSYVRRGSHHNFLHQEIMKPPKGMEVHHINGNGLDNRRDNLRIVTRARNVSDERMGYVQRINSRYRARCGMTTEHNGKQVHLGMFDSYAEAEEELFWHYRDYHGF